MEAQLQAKTQLADRLNKELSAVSEGRDSERYLEEELIVAKLGLAEQREANSLKEEQIGLLKSQLAELANKDLDSAELNKKLQTVRQQSLEEKSLLKRNLATLENDLKLQRAKVKSLKVELGSQQSSVADRSSNIAKQNKELAEKDAQIAEQSKRLASTAEELASKNQELANKNQKL